MSFCRRTSLLLCALCFGATLSLAGLAHAGEVKVGPQKLAVDDSGNITDAGRKVATEELKNEPGDDEIWIAHLWAKLDKGAAPGPLNIEFYGTLPDGKSYLAFRKVEDGYDGGKYFSVELELDGDDGFNKNKQYKIEITQLDDKGKEFKLASGKVKLAWVDHKEEPSKGEEGGKEEGGKAESDTAEQDQLDTISGGGDGGGGEGGGPPPVEPKKKKGCAIEPEGGGVIGLAALFALGAFTRRRRSA